jgi:hypothetical protein
VANENYVRVLPDPRVDGRATAATPETPEERKVDAVSALHTAARRACDERAREWFAAYDKLGRTRDDRIRRDDGSCDHSDAALNIFPRYQVLAAIQREVERFTPADFSSTEECRTFLVLAAETAPYPYPTSGMGPIERAAIADERRVFGDWVRTLSAATLSSVEPLPYRRVLGHAEAAELTVRLVARWGNRYGGGVDRDDVPPTLTLWDHWFEDETHLAALRKAIVEHGHSRVWEIREYDECFEMDVSAVEFAYTGPEGFWTTGDMDWLVYASHEQSISFGGDWIIEEVKKACPDWEGGLYEGWVERPPQRER